MPITTVPPSIITGLGETPATDHRPQDAARLEIPRPVILEIEPRYVAPSYDPHLKTRALKEFQRAIRSEGTDEADPLSRFVTALETNPGLLIPFNDAMAEYTRGLGETDGQTDPLFAMWSGVLCFVAESPVLRTRFNTPHGAFPDYIRQLYEGLNTRYDVTDPKQHIRLMRLLGGLGANPAFPLSRLGVFREAMRYHGARYGATKAEIKEIIDYYLAKRADNEIAQ